MILIARCSLIQFPKATVHTKKFISKNEMLENDTFVIHHILLRLFLYHEKATSNNEQNNQSIEQKYRSNMDFLMSLSCFLIPFGVLHRNSRLNLECPTFGPSSNPNSKNDRKIDTFY
jgi:hypothetical protein